MKRLLLLLPLLACNLVMYGQCSEVSVQVSASDTSYVQLYHAGFFNIPSGFANICTWEVRSFSGTVIHQETTSGEANEQSSVIFDHTTPLTDSMHVSIFITNDLEGISCTMNDTLYWKETEVLPGTFIGNWEVLSSNGGIEQELTRISKMSMTLTNIELYPSPTDSYFSIKSTLGSHSFAISDSQGRIMDVYTNLASSTKVNVSHYTSGLYIVHFYDEKQRIIAFKKLMKY